MAPGSSPVPRWTARLMLSAGMFSALAAAMAVRSRGLPSGSPPLLAAMVISLIRRVKILPRFASSAPFLCLIVAHLEWPDMWITSKNQRFRQPDEETQAYENKLDYSTLSSLCPRSLLAAGGILMAAHRFRHRLENPEFRSNLVVSF